MGNRNLLSFTEETVFAFCCIKKLYFSVPLPGPTILPVLQRFNTISHVWGFSTV